MRISPILAIVSSAFIALAAAVDAEPRFVDEAARSGLAFDHRHGASGELFYPEIFAPASHSSTMTTTATWTSISSKVDV